MLSAFCSYQRLNASLLALLLAFSVHDAVWAQTKKIDSLKAELSKKTLADTSRVNCSTKLSHLLLRNRALEEAKLYATKARDLALSIHFNKGYLNAINALASYYSEAGNYPGSIALYKDYIAECGRNKNEKGSMYGYNNLGLTFRAAGNYDEALAQFFKALEIAEKDKAKNQKSIAMYLNNISLVYADYNNYAKAIEYVERAIAIAEQAEGQEESIIIRAINLGTYYRESQQPEKAIHLLTGKIALNDTTLKNAVYDAYMRNNLGQSYSDVNLEQKALREYLKAREIFRQAEEHKFVSQITVNMALSYSKLGERTEALSLLKEGLAGVARINDPELQRYATQVASLVYEKAGDHKNALRYANKSAALKDSLLTKQQAEAIIEMQTKYETRQKEDAIRYQKAQITNQMALNKETEKSLKQKTLLLFISVTGLIIISLLAFLALANYRKKQKTNELLQEQKKTIEQKNAENELLLGEIHHRVKNNLQVISSLLSLQERSVDDPAARSAILEGKERVRSMELVHKMLYHENSFSGIEMKEYVLNLSNGLIESFGLNKGAEEVVLQSNFKKITLDVDTAIPLGLILNELIVNSLKYARQESPRLFLKIDMKESSTGTFQLNISDNGPGKVSDIEASGSFGLKIVRALVKQLNGAIVFSEQNGLHYSIEIKNYKLIV